MDKRGGGEGRSPAMALRLERGEGALELGNDHPVHAFSRIGSVYRREVLIIYLMSDSHRRRIIFSFHCQYQSLAISTGLRIASAGR